MRAGCSSRRSAHDKDPQYGMTVRLGMLILAERQWQVKLRIGKVTGVELHTGSKAIPHYPVKPL